jgi:hypothetical protein
MDGERHPPQRPTGRAAMTRHPRPGATTRLRQRAGRATAAPHPAAGVTA